LEKRLTGNEVVRALLVWSTLHGTWREKLGPILGALLLTGLLSACGGYRTQVIDTPETRGLKGWQKPYLVNGKRYDPLLTHEGFVQEGSASWYGADFHGRQTSSGETYDMYALTAAHKTLPLGVFVKVRNLLNGSEVVVRVNDRGPFVKDRIIDLSYAAAKHLAITAAGTAPVRIEALGYRLDNVGAASYRSPASYDAGSFTVQVAAFTNRDNAERLADRMRKNRGYAAIEKALVNGYIFYRVRVGSYGSLTRAEEARRKFEQEGFPGSFVVALD
jgi:rare lipoprotein A